MSGRCAILTVTAAACTALCCAGSGAPEETLEAFHGHMAAKDFAGAAEFVSYAEADPAAERGVYAARLAATYDADGLDYGRAEIRDRRSRGPGEVEFTVSYPRRSRPSTPPVTRRLTVKRIRDAWYCIIEPTEATEMPKRSE